MKCQVYHVTHLPLYTGKLDNLTDTPWKINGWNLQMTHVFQGNDPDQKFHDGMFQPLIFTSWWFFTNPVEKHAQVKFDDFPNFSR